MAEFSIGDNQYRSGRMNAFQQFHVARKLGPVLAKIGPAIMQASDQDWLARLEPLVEAMAAMPEEDCNYILTRCLAVVSRFQGAAWAQVWNEPAKRLMFEDIDMSVMIQIAIQVLGDNLSNFFTVPPSSLSPLASQAFDTLPNSFTSTMGKTG